MGAMIAQERAARGTVTARFTYGSTVDYRPEKRFGLKPTCGFISHPRPVESAGQLTPT